LQAKHTVTYIDMFCDRLGASIAWTTIGKEFRGRKGVGLELADHFLDWAYTVHKPQCEK